VTRTAGPAAPPDSPDLDARYGRTPGARRRTLLLGVSAAVAVAVVMILWVVWAGLDEAAPTLDVQDIGYQRLGDDEVRVRWQLTLEPGSEAQCSVKALDEHYEIVGWKTVHIPASDEEVRVFAETVRTVSPFNSGLLSKCWLP
jgi:Domain of unknown function (DUF4307)